MDYGSLFISIFFSEFEMLREAKLIQLEGLNFRTILAMFGLK